MEKHLTNLALTIAFLTRVPLPKRLGDKISHDASLAEAAGLFPVTGFLIAIPIALLWFCTSLILPATVAAGLALALSVLLTGGLHEDGLADCADGLGATPKRERSLEIMRDSRIGTYGAIALVFSIGLRWAALASFAPFAGVLAILITMTASRSAMTIAMRYSSYAREDGLGKQASNMPSSQFLLAMGIAVLVAAVLGWHWGLAALALGLSSSWLFLKYLEKRLGGYTGDGLGAMEQIAATVVLITLAGAWS